MVETIEKKSNDKIASENQASQKALLKIVVLGSNGMLGYDLVPALKKARFYVAGFGREKLDITKKSDFFQLEKNKPDMIINCAAYTNVELAETERQKCRAINVTGVKNIVDFCRKNSVTLMHISTDYVFDGKKKFYNEDDKKNPLGYYGRTKAESEDLIASKLEKYYIIRTSLVFGKKRKNFVSRIMKMCRENREVEVVDSLVSSPTYTKDLAQGIAGFISAKRAYGIYHMTNNDYCSRYELALEIRKLGKYRCDIRPISLSQIKTRAKRPGFSILVNNKLPKLRHWKKALAAYTKEPGHR